MKMLAWWRMLDPVPTTPYIVMCKSFDVPETIAAMIRSLPPGAVAVALCRRGGKKMIDTAYEAADERNVRIIWWNGPQDMTVPPEARPDFEMLKALTHHYEKPL